VYWNNLAYVRFEVFTAVTMMNAVFWVIETQFVPQREHFTSPLQSYVRFEVFAVVNMKNAIFWDVTPRGSCKNNDSEERIVSIIMVTRIGELVKTFSLKIKRCKPSASGASFWESCL
jgi:hypothetical protein